MEQKYLKVSRDAYRMLYYPPKRYEELLLLEAALWRRGFRLVW